MQTFFLAGCRSNARHHFFVGTVGPYIRHKNWTGLTFQILTVSDALLLH